MHQDTAELLRAHGIQPSAQRVAVAEYVLHTGEHPSADVVYNRVRDKLPVLSRATVYNTLNLLVGKGLLRQLALEEGNVVFDPRVEPHHHFIDDITGQIFDVPWSSLRVASVDALDEYEVREYSVVMRGLRKPRRAK